MGNQQPSGDLHAGHDCRGQPAMVRARPGRYLDPPVPTIPAVTRSKLATVRLVSEDRGT
jgi:hypothetical protein